MKQTELKNLTKYKYENSTVDIYLLKTYLKNLFLLESKGQFIWEKISQQAK